MKWLNKLFDKLGRFSEYLQTFGPAGLFAIALLDSALIPLPGGPDAVMLLLSAQSPARMPLYALGATAGALEYPRWRFMLTVMIARSLRYIVEGTLAVFYGERVLVFMRVNGLAILSIVAALLVVGIGGYVLVKHIRTPRKTAVEIVEEREHEGAAVGKVDEGKAAD